MLSFIFGFGLARPIFLAAVLAALPILIWQWRSMTHFPAFMQMLLLLMRVGVVLAIAFALVGPQRVEQNFKKFVLFVVDQSGSVPAGGYETYNSYISEAVKNQGDNQYAVLPFAGRPGAVVNSPLKGAAGEKSPLTPLNPSYTDYAKASVLAEAIVPEDSVGEVVLISDFLIAKNAPEEARQINEFGIDAHAVNIAAKSEQAEILVDSVVAPARIRVGQPVQIEVRVESNTPQKTVVISLNEAEAAAAQANAAAPQFVPQTIEFTQAGVKFVRFDFTPSKIQTYQFVATISGEGDSSLTDTLLENNTASAATVSLPQGKILLVENKPNLASPLSKALAAEFLTVTACTAETFPESLDDFEAIILSNTPATGLMDFDQMRLEEYVASGGGLIALGGDQSFTAGGWHGTTLEELMPVECVPSEKQPRPSLSMVLVMDRSLSMEEGGAIELAKEAARRAVGVLAATDQLGIITYEDNYAWNVPLSALDDKDTVLKKIDAIKADGRTNLYPALERACQALEESFSDLKHIIVLTDGVSQPGDFDGLAKTIAQRGITMSSVAVGEEADPQILSDLAKYGKGTMYACKDPAELPSIFALETASAAKIGIIERTTKLQSAGALSSLGKFDASKSPSLLGYVQTKAKPGASVVYAAPAIDGVSDPILTWHRYKGNAGVVAAFTSDIESRWSRAWQRWDGFGPFWARLVNHVRRSDPADSYKICCDGQKLTVKGAVSESGLLECTLQDKEGKTISAPLVAPGVFQIDAAGLKGEYTVEVKDNNVKIWSGKTAIVHNYTDEFRLNRSESLKSESLPSAIEAANVFDKSDKSVSKTYRYWQYLLWLGVCLTTAEVFFRRTGIA